MGAMTEHISTSALRVLVVEDNPDAANSLKLLLSRWGHEVRVTYDGPSALEVARLFWPHVVVLDIGLPGMDGWQIASLMREQPCTKAAVLLAVTAYGQETDVQRSLTAGLHDHMVKPVDPRELKGVLDRLAAAQAAGALLQPSHSS